MIDGAHDWYHPGTLYWKTVCEVGLRYRQIKDIFRCRHWEGRGGGRGDGACVCVCVCV